MGFLIGGVIRNSANHYALPFAKACISGGSLDQCATTDGNGVWNALWGYEGVNVTASAGGFSNKQVNFTKDDLQNFPDYGKDVKGYWKIIELDPLPAPPASSSSSSH